jgi:hypothetical protein
MARRLKVTRQTAWMFMYRVRMEVKNSELHFISGHVLIDEFVYGGKEDLKQGRSSDSKKKKIFVAVEVDNKRGVKRAYFKRIDNYSSKELSKIFVSHVSTDAKITTNKWKGYLPLKKDYNITQIKSNVSDFFEREYNHYKFHTKGLLLKPN